MLKERYTAILVRIRGYLEVKFKLSVNFIFDSFVKFFLVGRDKQLFSRFKACPGIKHDRLFYRINADKIFGHFVF